MHIQMNSHHSEWISVKFTFAFICLLFNSREEREGTERTQSSKGTKGQERAKAKEREGRWFETIEIEFLKEIRKLEHFSMVNHALIK